MIRLQVHFAVKEGSGEAFERMYEQVYLPALRRQPGFVGSSLLRTYPANVLEEIGFAAPRYTYQLELDFDTEENRRRWAESRDHEEPWTQATALAESIDACGYDVVSSRGAA